MDRFDAGDVRDVFFNFVERDTGGDCLQEDLGCRFYERESGGEDDDCDEEGDGRVEVQFPAVLVRDVHETQGDDHDTDITQGIAEDVQEDTAHVEVLVGVSGGALRFRFGVVVALVAGAGVGAFTAFVARFRRGITRL